MGALLFPRSQNAERSAFLVEFNAVINSFLGVGSEDHRDLDFVTLLLFFFITRMFQVMSIYILTRSRYCFQVSREPKGNLRAGSPTNPWALLSPCQLVFAERPFAWACAVGEFNKVVFSSLWQRDLKSELMKLKERISLVLRKPPG